MNERVFKPTPQQDKVIRHADSAFITACPGAGKTCVMAERARHILRRGDDGCGISFLSFTRAAVSELESRLRRMALLGPSNFPHFVGTFDSFIWQFLVAPFGIPETDAAPRLIPDKGTRLVQPFDQAQPLPLSCFDRVSGKIDAAAALRAGFDVNNKKLAHVKAAETSARQMHERFRERGELDFDEARALGVARLADAKLAIRLSAALRARFREIVVDEAQDSNPGDLEIVKWLRDAGIPTKVICDPHQSIYAFRGGVTDHLFAFARTFADENRLSMNGNFRSSGNICKAITMLRATEARAIVDAPLGEFKDENAHVYVFSYEGKKVTDRISAKFVQYLNAMRIEPSDAPVLAATRNSGSKAIGQPVVATKMDLTARLAEAVSDFYFAFESGNQKSAIERVHKVILELQGRLPGRSYHQCVVAYELKSDQWRPEVLHILRALRYDPQVFSDAEAWHRRAKDLLGPYLVAEGVSISQKLKWNKDIVHILTLPPSSCPPARTIHSVKGMEFPAVCVVTIAQTLKSILDYLETGMPPEKAEDARELYVAASRAQRLLVIAAPRGQSERLAAHLRKAGAGVTVVTI